MQSLWRPLDEGRLTTLPIQIVMRWVLVAVALFIVNYEPGTSASSRLVLNALIVGGAALNGLLQSRLRARASVITALPVALAVYDVAAITTAVGVVDRFDNGVFVLYYPALLAFTLVFPGRWSLAYTAVTIGAYLVAVVPHESFDPGHATDLKQLVARLASMGTTVLIANLVVGIERARRERAVAEAVAASSERQRIANELHDSVAQSVYMLTMNLEANADLVDREVEHPTLGARMQVLVPMARRALLETRSLLFDLEAPLSGDEPLSELVRRHVEEFAAVTGVQVEFEPDGTAAWIDPQTTVEVYRVVQESLANVYRHAGVDTAQVRLRGGPPLIVEVSDRGAGFEQPGRESGRGLAGMRERAQRIGAELTVLSTIDLGTTVRLEYAGAE
jgi:signal transduction histidine kinase